MTRNFKNNNDIFSCMQVIIHTRVGGEVNWPLVKACLDIFKFKTGTREDNLKYPKNAIKSRTLHTSPCFGWQQY